MSFTISTFADLAARFPEWDTLKSWLESDEGGSLRVIPTSYPSLFIIRYMKEKSDMTKEHVRHFRSVVWNSETNRPVCVSPVKAEQGLPADGAELIQSEFIDGIMISRFVYNDEQILATRTNVGATNSFYTEKTFAQMFDDAVDGDEHHVGGMASYMNMILQHPEHKTVGAVQSPRIIETHYGVISEDGTVTVHVASSSTPISFSQTEMNRQMGDAVRRSGHMFQGLVFQDPNSSRRWRVRSMAYTKVRSLRGAEASSFARFLRLRGEGKMKDYLRYFPEESNLMWAMEQAWRGRTKKLYEYYSDKNKAKNIGLTDIPHPFRQHIYKIHGKYLEQVAAVKAGIAGALVHPITLETIIDYVNALPMEDKMRFMNGECDSAAFLASVAAPAAPARPAVARGRGGSRGGVRGRGGARGRGAPRSSH